MRLLLRITAIVLLVSRCSTVTPPPNRVIEIAIVATTDVHGRFTRQETPEHPRFGGLDLLAGYVENLRQAMDGRVILLDAGDIFQGTLASNMTEGDVMIVGYNRVGYTAAAIGNHEFDYGPSGERSVVSVPSEDPFSALERNIANAAFPFLSANIREKATGRRPWWARPSFVVEHGGVRVGIIGLTTVQTPGTTFPTNVESLAFTDPAKETVEVATSLRRGGVDAIVVVAHIGGSCSALHDPEDLSSCSATSEVFNLANALPPGTVDVIAAGHTHAQMAHRVNGIAIVQAAAFGRAFARVDLSIDSTSSRVAGTRIHPPVMICESVYEGTDTCDPAAAPAGARLVQRLYEGRPVQPVTVVAEALAPYQKNVEEKEREKTGVVLADPFTRRSAADGSGDTALGNLVADTLREIADSDFGMANPGGLRTDLAAGELTYGALFRAFPFDNLLATIDLTGEELVALLDAALDYGRMMQVSGMKVEVDRAARSSGGDGISVTLSDGSAIDPRTLYKLALVDFLAAGGDGLEPVTSRIPRERIRVFNERPFLRDLLADAWRARAQPLVPLLDGRILYKEE